MNSLSNVIFYVEDVPKTMAFYEKAFAIPIAFIDPSGHYGQMETGTTALSFASLELAKQNLVKGVRPFSPKEIPPCEITFSSKDIHHSLAQAVKAGAELLSPPEEKPWGQMVAFVRDFNGILIELATEMAPSCSSPSECSCC